jgi:hypothetical protein
MTWTRAIHIQHWADTLPAQGDLPLLLRRLIRNTVPRSATVNFPAEEQSHRAGFDGVVSVSQGNQFVPSGDSVWEMGVNKDKAGKADEDFDKRTKSTPKEEQSKRTYVAVTPRHWENKDEWAAEKKANSNWKDVVALDCNDLEHWLELSAFTDLWFATRIGQRPRGVRGLADHWQSLAAIASGRTLKPNVFLTSREGPEQKVLNWMSGEPSSLLLRAKSFDAGVDFVTALAAKHSAAVSGLDRLILASDRESWHQLAVSGDQFVLIPSDELALTPSEIAEANRFGHHVLVCESQSSAIQPELIIDLPEADHYALSDALVESGFPEAQARTFARACCGSTVVLKRLITSKPATVFPAWSRAEQAAYLAPYALFGGWQHVDPPTRAQPSILPDTTPIDLFFLQEFLGRSRQEIDDTIARWSSGPEALFRRFGSHVVVASREDAWHLLGGHLSPEHISRFEEVACMILEEVDPAYDLENDQRWMANIQGKVLSLSAEVRNAIVESMVLMTTFPTAISPASSIDFQATCRRILERALPANSSWKRWASLGQNLSLLAECDPEYFLMRVEQDLASAKPELPKLFQDKGHSFFSRAEHTNLLWALEVLSWNPDYLERVLAALARLGDHDPGGTYGNRPDASIKDILILGRSSTGEQRVAAMRKMVEAAPRTAWKVIAAILPGGHGGLGMVPQMPRWRPWANQRVAVGEYGAKAYVAIVEMIEDSLKEWSIVLDGLIRLRSEETCSRLEKVTDSATDASEGAFALWSELREITHHHRRHAGAPWVFTDEILDRLEKVRDRLQPTDPALQHSWLFERHVELPDVPRDDFQKQRTTLQGRRIEALHDVIKSGGFAAIQRLIRLCGSSWEIGQLVGELRLLEWIDIGVPRSIEHDSEFHDFARCYASGRFFREKWDGIKELPISSWTVTQRINLALSLPFQRDVWDWIMKFSADDATAYWDNVRLNYPRVADEDAEFAIACLVSRGRPFTAIEILDCQQRDGRPVDVQLALSLLLAGLEAREAPGEHGRYSIERLIGHLQTRQDCDLNQLARIEWGYIGIFDDSPSGLVPKTLEGAIAKEPQLFAMLLEKLYRDENTKPGTEQVTEDVRVHARHARILLDNLSAIPGERDNGTIDFSVTKEWIDKVRPLAKAVGRSAMGDFEIGRLLFKAVAEEGRAPDARLSDILETLKSDDVLDGYANALLYSRGTTSRLPFDGGKQEHELADKYRVISRSFATSHPNISNLYARVAQNYEADAKREDLEAERERLGR